jgi:hypothetical protein
MNTPDPLVPLPVGQDWLPIRVAPGCEATGDALVSVLEAEGIEYRNAVHKGVLYIEARCPSDAAMDEVLTLCAALVEDGF